MCDFKERFKLCICNSIDVDEADWTLERYSSTEEALNIIGEWGPPWDDPTREEAIEMILKELNNRNCFDFDYQPKSKDLLKICVNKKKVMWVDILYQGKEWIYEGEDPFGPNKQQLIAYRHGLVKK